MINTKMIKAVPRKSANKMAQLIRMNTSRRFTESEMNQREYRVLTAGEDGCVYFWNIMASYNG